MCQITVNLVDLVRHFIKDAVLVAHDEAGADETGADFACSRSFRSDALVDNIGTEKAPRRSFGPATKPRPPVMGRHDAMAMAENATRRWPERVRSALEHP